MTGEAAIDSVTKEAAGRLLDAGLSRRNRLPRRSAAVGALLFAAAGLAYVEFFSQASPPRFETAHVTRGDLLATVAATGKIEAKTKVEVGTDLSGSIKDVKVDFNSRVDKGDVLAVFDASEYQVQVTQSQADLKAAIANEYQAAATLREADGRCRMSGIHATSRPKTLGHRRKAEVRHAELYLESGFADRQ